jgi:hypothetical protein
MSYTCIGLHQDKQAFIYPFLIMEAHVQALDSLCTIFVGQSRFGTGFFFST